MASLAFSDPGRLICTKPWHEGHRDSQYFADHLCQPTLLRSRPQSHTYIGNSYNSLLIQRTAWPSTNAFLANDNFAAICCLQARAWEQFLDGKVVSADQTGHYASTQQDNFFETPAKIVKDAGTSHNLSPETGAELDCVLLTPNLPFTPPSPIPDPQAVLAALSPPSTPASSTPFAPAEVAKALQDLTADNLEELLSILTAPQAPSPVMDSLELSPGSASQLLPPVPQTPLSTLTALSLESHFLEDWLLDPESPSPAQAQVQGPFMQVPCSQPQNPVGPSHLTPRVTSHSQVTSLHSCLSLFTCALLSVYCSTHKHFCEVL